MKNLKYLALGILVGYLLPYIYFLTHTPKATERKNFEEEETE
jgi:hypothetical protein